MDILDLDIAILTDQYLNFINDNLDQLQIDNASEYLVMASYLIELKSKKLLPEDLEGKNQSNFEYERDKLVQRILEYRKYKQAVQKLIEKQNKRKLMLEKKPDDLTNYLQPNQPLSIEKLPNNINPNRLLSAVEKALDKYREIIYSQRKIIVQELSVDDIENEIKLFLKKHENEEISFSNYLESLDEFKISQQYIVTSFLALLELAKYRYVDLIQKSLEDEIYFVKNNNPILIEE